VSRVLVLTGLEVEARRLAAHLSLGRVVETPWPHYRAGGLEVVAVGLAASHLAERLASGAARPALVVSAGVCGALAPHLPAAALVVPEAVVDPDGSRWPTAAWPALRRQGTLLTVREPVARPEAKARLWAETGALAVDMESAAVLRWAREAGRPAVVVRAVADTAAEALASDVLALVGPAGAVRAGRTLGLALRRPHVLAGALALGRATDHALRAVARVLGELARW
jgi:nucleoside phosphorylase